MKIQIKQWNYSDEIYSPTPVMTLLSLSTLTLIIREFLFPKKKNFKYKNRNELLDEVNEFINDKKVKIINFEDTCKKEYGWKGDCIGHSGGMKLTYGIEEIL